LQGRWLLTSSELYPLQLLQPVKVPLEAMVAGFIQLVGDSSQMPVDPLGIFFWRVNSLASLDTVFILPLSHLFLFYYVSILAACALTRMGRYLDG
jgi:hypothetical protein